MSTHVTGFAPPDEQWAKMRAIWDACMSAGSQYYLRYRHSFGSAERVRRGADEWLDGDRRETVGEFETDEQDGGVISLEEFCGRAGLELRLA